MACRDVGLFPSRAHPSGRVGRSPRPGTCGRRCGPPRRPPIRAMPALRLLARCAATARTVFGDAAALVADHPPPPGRGVAGGDRPADRIIHVALFGALFVLALELRLNIGPLHDVARRFLDALNAVAANSTQGASHGFLVTELQRIVDLREGALDVLIGTSLAYTVLELVEAIGLWHERRWAEYLTVVATAGLLPFEILELSRRV